MSGSLPTNYVSANGVAVILDSNLNAAVQLVPTAAAARGFIAISSMTIVLQGVSAPNDGQGGVFYWVVGNYTDDGVNTLVPSGAIGQGAWLRLTISGVSASSLASPPPIGSVTPNTGAFTTLSANGTVSGAGFSSYLSQPPIIGGGTPNSGFFTTLAVNSTVSGAGFTTYLASPPAIGGSAAAAGSFTTLSASSTVSGTGFSTYLASPPAIGGTAPAAGSFTTLSATGNFTPSQTNGIVGTTTNNNANAGSVGEVISSIVLVGSAVSLSTGMPANVTSISLTAGDWDVYGNVVFNAGSGTTVTAVVVSINRTTAALGDPSLGLGQTLIELQATMTTSDQQAVNAGSARVSIASTTTVYLVAQASFGVSTMVVYGNIWARRAR